MNDLQHKLLVNRVTDVITDFVIENLPFTAQDISVKVIEGAIEERLGFAFHHKDVNDILVALFKQDEFQFMGVSDDIVYVRTSIEVNPRANDSVKSHAWLYHFKDFDISTYDNCKPFYEVAPFFIPNKEDVEKEEEYKLEDAKPVVQDINVEFTTESPQKEEKNEDCQCCNAQRCNPYIKQNEEKEPFFSETERYTSEIKIAASNLLENTANLSFVLGLKLINKLNEAISKIK